jgi:uncharacterized membrane protein (Fun14 family)
MSNEILINIFFYVGYATCISLLVAIFITSVYYIFLFLTQIKSVYNVIMQKGLNNLLKKMSNDKLEEMIRKIRKQHSVINKSKKPEEH